MLGGFSRYGVNAGDHSITSMSMPHVHQKPLGHTRMCRDNYKTERLWATAPDGTKVCKCFPCSCFYSLESCCI